jgi:integrase
MSIKIPAGLRGSIYRTGKNSYRLQLSLGRNAQGEYENKRETIRGTEQDALNLLTRWNVQYLDNIITTTNYETVKGAYEQWIAKHVERFLAPNTRRFYKQRFADDLLPHLGHMRLKDVTLGDMADALAANPANDQHNKRALRAFFNWCTDMGKLPNRFDFRKLRTQAKPKGKSEEDVWSFEEVRQVYSALTFDNLYDIFIVLGIECGLRPGEILALRWDKIHQDCLVIDQAVKERTPTAANIGGTKTEQARRVATTPYLHAKLTVHSATQQLRIENTAGYDTEAGFVVADSMGRVPDLNYIRKYMRQVARRAGVHPIPPKNLRSTWASLMGALGIPLSLIQQAAGHSSPDTTSRHYVRVFDASLKEASKIYHDRLHGEPPNS